MPMGDPFYSQLRKETRASKYAEIFKRRHLKAYPLGHRLTFQSL